MNPRLNESASEILRRLAAVIEARKGGDAATSYVARLLGGPEDSLLKKIGEEATEAVLAAKAGDRLALVNEFADLWFHSLIVLARYGLGPDDVLMELKRREGISGIDEKAARSNSERARAEKG
jgi:phosphoribosyl-ATP pyrophosphohydrolase